MKPVLTAGEAAALDRETQARGVPGATLMERAGWAVARAVVDVLGGAYGRRALVVCGKGNNGGDGYVAARHLSRWGVRVDVLAVEQPAGIAATMRDRLANETTAGIAAASPAGLARALGRADVVVDALLGTGSRGEPAGATAVAIAALNGATVPVVAVDLASGVDASTGAVPGAAVRADLTVAFGAAKAGSVLLPGAELAGDLRVADIGFPDELVPETTGLTEPSDVAAVLPAREADAHKKASTLVLVAGSREMTGAARLVATAAARIGAGYVVVAVPSSILPIVQTELTETVFLGLPETDDGTVAGGAREILLERAAAAHALAIGPGLSMNAETAGLVRDLVRSSPVPVVLDADGLNAYAGRASDLADRKADLVLTPHLGELARLRDGDATDRLAAARDLARATEAVAVVKGTRSVIAEPGGAARINPTGTSALATAGTGDVLTGTIGGLLARGLEPFAAAWAGAYIHGLAGILASGEDGEGIVAGDVAELLPEALALVRRQA